MASTPDGRGYWLVASDGGIFTYGDAAFYGSTGSIHLNQPIVGMAPTPDGSGYWLVASDGGIFTYGDAPFDGSLGGSGATVLGMTVSPFHGYDLVTSDGVAHQFTSAASAAAPLTTVFPTANIVGGPPQQDCAPSTLPTATPDQGLDQLFSSESGPGWVGGDATYSTALPNGQEAFVFSDTLIGTAQATGAAHVQGMPHSSELFGTMPDLATDIGGSYGSPASLIPDSNGADTWQIASTYMENGSQLVFVNEFAPVAGSLFDSFAGRSGIAVLSLASGAPTLSSVVLLPTDPTTQWGNAMTQSDGYDYAYGIDGNGSVLYGMKIARVPIGESLQPSDWTYWTGSGWSPAETNAVPVQTGTVLTGVIGLANDSGFMAVSVPGGVWNDSTVDLSFSCSPTGPWSTPKAIYTIPQLHQYPNEIAYIPTFHPELSNGALVMSYNINSLSGLAALEQNDHLYQPLFLDLR
jgi:hypothetical protein